MAVTITAHNRAVANSTAEKAACAKTAAFHIPGVIEPKGGVPCN
ncbi:MAG: hypothetical protein WAK17_25845 [Candidatus Nitrosopolaris sp.]|jgi:hypothetical protein